MIGDPLLLDRPPPADQAHEEDVPPLKKVVMGTPESGVRVRAGPAHDAVLDAVFQEDFRGFSTFLPPQAALRITPAARRPEKCAITQDIATYA